MNNIEKLQNIFKILRKDDEEGHGSAYELQWEDIEAIENLIKENKYIHNELNIMQDGLNKYAKIIEEKEAIEELKKVRWNSLAVVVKNEDGKMDISYFTEKHKKTLLNLIQKREKIIDKMAEEIYEHRYQNNLNFFKNKITAKQHTTSVKEIVEYFKKEVEKE